jgi:hypothetical protein
VFDLLLAIMYFVVAGVEGFIFLVAVLVSVIFILVSRQEAVRRGGTGEGVHS